MKTLKDEQLLLEYAAKRSEAAFEELVGRHVDLTYSVALRLVRDPHLAEDVTQAVFVALAQNAAQLAGHPVLSGWLHRAARNVAAQTVRTEVRRRAREQEAIAMNQLLATSTDPTWEQIVPHLDDALAGLDELDRDVILLRYFEKKSAQEMASILGISAEAAQKRVSRAVDQLREMFAKRGAAVASGVLVLWLSTNSVQAAPVGLTASVASAATLAGATGTATMTVGANSTAVTAMQIANVPVLAKILLAGTFAAVVGFGIYEARLASELRSRNEQLQAQLQAMKNNEATQANRRDIPGVDTSLWSGDGPTGSPAVLNLSPIGGAPTPDFPPNAGKFAEQASKIAAQMKEQQRRLIESHGGGTTLVATADGPGATGQSTIGTKSVNGVTSVIFKGREFVIGGTVVLVSTKATSVDGNDFAAAYDDGRVIWENVPGAAERLK